MATLDQLPSDQRAVLELVLRQGRGYDEIAQLLRIDRAAVRARALAAIDALSPPAELGPEQRGLITDYLLGQLPAAVTEYAEQRLAASEAERAWAERVAGELAALAPGSAPVPHATSPVPAGNGHGDITAAATHIDEDANEQAEAPAGNGGHAVHRTAPRPSSRRGGAILLAVAGLVVIGLIVLIIVLLTGGGGNKSASNAPAGGASGSAGNTASGQGSTPNAAASSSTSTVAPTGAATAGGASTTQTTTGAGIPTGNPVAKLTLKPPSSTSKAKGVAGIYSNGAIVLVAAGVPRPPAHQAYTVWLSNSALDSEFLGWVVEGVSRDGALLTRGTLPANASHYRRLLVTLQPITNQNPRTPGRLILSAPFSAP